MHESPAFLLGAHFFGIVKGEQPLTRCGESGVQRSGGGIRNTPPYLWPARSAKPFDQKKKPAPRHQRENQLKEKTSSASGPRGAQSHLTERENIPRATSARSRYPLQASTNAPNSPCCAGSASLSHSGCHWTPRQKCASGFSSASTMPSSLRAAISNSGAMRSAA